MNFKIKAREFLTSAARDQRPSRLNELGEIARSHSKETSSEGVREAIKEVIRLFYDSPELLNRFLVLVPEKFRVDINSEMKQLLSELYLKYPDSKEDFKRKKSKIRSGIQEHEYRFEVFKCIRATYPEEEELVNKFWEQFDYFFDLPPEPTETREIQGNSSSFGTREKSQRISYPQNLPIQQRHEYAFFSECLNSVFSDKAQKYFLKVLFLYSECIITIDELLENTEEILPEGLQRQLKEICLWRDADRRNRTKYFKQYSGINLDNIEKGNHSYRKIPEDFPQALNYGRGPLESEIFNLSWFSVQTGSEHTRSTFHIKNNYEESLFKIEDERYEFDLVILHFQKGIELCDRLLKSTGLPTKRSLIKRLSKNKAVLYLYKHEAEKILQVLASNTLETASLVRLRLRTKLMEIEDGKEVKRKKWEEDANKNFYRSLDNMSFYFKHFDKKNVTKNMFLKEAVQRREIMRYLEAMKDKFQEGTRFERCSVASAEVKGMCPKSFFEKFNTFKSVSNDIMTQPSNFPFAEEITKGQNFRLHEFPQFILSYTNHQVLRDITALLEWFKETTRLNEKVLIPHFFSAEHLKLIETGQEKSQMLLHELPEVPTGRADH